MKQEKFCVFFTNGRYPTTAVNVDAFNLQEALILAQAKRIKDGLDYTVHEIVRYGGEKKE